MTWYSGLEDVCRPEVPLCDYTWYKLGGPARWFLTPRDEAETLRALTACRRHDIPWRVLGHGANLLVRDEGVAAAVFQFGGEAFESVRFEENRVHAAAGADFTKLVKKACARGLAGLEALAGIPGTLGGIVRMNAGGKYGEIGTFVRSVRVINCDGQVAELPAASVGFRYRHTDLDGCVVVGATLELTGGEAEELLTRYREIWNEKYATQPPVSDRSAGCIFKNPPGHAAGKLIDEAGLKGKRIGDAEISAKHANFIVALPGATAADILELIQLAQEQVLNKFGINLHTEVEIW